MATAAICCENDGGNADTGWFKRAAQAAQKGPAQPESFATCRRSQPGLVRRLQGMVPMRRWEPLRSADDHGWLQPLSVARTMGEMLTPAGLSVPRKLRRKAPPSQSPLRHAGGANQVWCADFKGWFRCGDGSRCDPLTIT